MPHLIIEYSANLQETMDLTGLIDRLHETTAASGITKLKGIRTRAARRDHYHIADGHPDNGFVHIVVRMRHGRPLEVRKRFGEQLFDVICRHLKPLYDSTPLGISFEIQEIDPVLSFKQNNLQEWIDSRGGERGR